MLLVEAEHGTPYGITVLLDRSININLQNEAGETALHKASQGNKKENVSLLLSFVSDVNSQDNAGNTALHLASRKGHDKIVKLLTSHALMDLKRKNINGKTASDVAQKAVEGTIRERFNSFKRTKAQVARLGDENKYLKNERKS